MNIEKYTLGYRILEEQELVEDTSSSMAYDLELPVDVTQKSSSRQELLKKFSSKQKLFSGSGPRHSTSHQHDPVTPLRRHLSSKRDDSDIREQDMRSGCLIRKPSGPKYLRNGRVQGISMNFDDSTYSDLE
ncbi:hypothetical protein WR25_12040 [Diploscapter pachys]|uniref:Uncharacterized protein n=1 Tax=Diploscapter pachys TaxID=2018661 RepID=A0A2A2LME6_9BILA|nr:hypothetical protein WR25_12040 [Diploscapter pachys]